MEAKWKEGRGPGSFRHKVWVSGHPEPRPLWTALNMKCSQESRNRDLCVGGGQR